MQLIVESDAPLKRREELIIPYTCIVRADGCAQWSAYPDAIDCLLPIQDKLFSAPFAAKTLTEVEACLASYLEKHGYEREEEDVRRYYETLAAPADFSHTATRSVRLDYDSFARYENKTDFTFDYTDQIAYATVLDGVIVSLAAENPNSTPDMCEIYTETHSDFRRRGYAKENVAALTAEKTKSGATVLYRCATDHVASLRIAKSLGFIHYDYFYCHNAYRID